MEIEFFGVSGTSNEDDSIQGSNNENENLSSLLSNISSEYDIKVNIINSKEQIKHINNLEIQQLQGFNITLSPTTIIQVFKQPDNKIKVIGKTSLKITDS